MLCGRGDDGFLFCRAGVIGWRVGMAAADQVHHPTKTLRLLCGFVKDARAILRTQLSPPVGFCRDQNISSLLVPCARDGFLTLIILPCRVRR